MEGGNLVDKIAVPGCGIAVGISERSRHCGSHFF
jgi:hypothetical protein